MKPFFVRMHAVLSSLISLAVLVQMLLATSEEELAGWRADLLASLGLDCSDNDPACPTGEGGFESSLRELINGYRQQTGLGHLVFDPQLYQLAQTHSTNMQEVDVLSHDGFQDRYDASGYRTCVENVAWNYPTPESLLSGWQNSSGHDRNLLNQNISFVGVARTGPYTTFFACGN